MIKLKFEISKWGGRISGGFHVGLFVDWEPRLFTVGLDLGWWCLTLEFQIPFNAERAERLKQKLKGQTK